jgi:serine/threonine protein kinase
MSANNAPVSSTPDREEALFQAAAYLSGPDRVAYLDRACAGDKALHIRLEALLSAHDSDDSAMAEPLNTREEATEITEAREAVGTTLGRYKLLEMLGEGGCGVVYVAEQTEPVRRRVALKVIKLGMDTKSVIARFEAERQALAMMDHPNIAKVLDAGATETGRPYFVMELVRGIKVTEYCDQNNVSTEERLDLFIKVCQAIQHAHQKGIIHRDIKPSNVLVTLHDGVPVPKVIDFGIAKATEGRLTSLTVYTELHQFIGTPAYMSPEQAEMSGLDIDTRSDIYSLGVLLYELLAGSTPFDARELMASGLDAMRKTIREQEPLRPSTRLATLQGEDLTATARRRSIDTSNLVRQLKGDLDWIVMKCLEKDRTRRYETANGLATDLKRHMINEPVLARPPSAAYKFQKAFRRNKLVYSAAAVVFVALSVGIALSAWQAVRARKAESLAKQRLADSESISKFMTEVFQSPDPERDGRTITVAETLGSAARKLETELAGQPVRRAKLQATLGETYRGLGLYSEAIPLLEKVRDYYKTASGPEAPETLEAALSLGGCYWAANRAVEGLKLLEEMLPLARKILGPEHTNTLTVMNDLALCYDKVGRRQESLQLETRVFSLWRKVGGPEHPETLTAMNNLAVSYSAAGRLEESLKLNRELLPLSRKVKGPEHPSTLLAMGNLAVGLGENGRWQEALDLAQEVLRLERKVLGPEHPTTLLAMRNLADDYSGLGHPAAALALREESVVLCRKILGVGNEDTIGEVSRLAGSYLALGRTKEGRSLLDELLSSTVRLYGPRSPQVGQVQAQRGFALDAAGLGDEAIDAWKEAIKIIPGNSPNTHYWLCKSLCDRGRFAEVLPVLQAALPLYPTGERSRDLSLWLSMTRSNLEPLGSKSSNPAVVEEILGQRQEAFAAHPEDSALGMHLAYLYLWVGRTNEHEALCKRMLESAQGSSDPSSFERPSKAYLINPDSHGELRGTAIAAAKRALELAPPGNTNLLAWFQLSRGIAAYRDHQAKDAGIALSEAVRLGGSHSEIRGLALLFRAMARAKLGQEDTARADLAEIEARITPLPEPTQIFPNLFKPDQLAILLAYKEAKALLDQPIPSKR